MDTLRNTLDSVAAGFGEQLYIGWVHPHSSGYSFGGACVSIDIRPANVDVDEPAGRTGPGFFTIKVRELRH